MLALDLIRFIPLCLVMAYAAKSDWQTTNVPNKIWLYTIIGGFLTLISTMYLTQPSFINIILSATFTIIIAKTLFFFNAWGGADTKALIALAFSAPLFPSWSILNSQSFPFSSFPFMALLLSSILILIHTLTTKTTVPLKQRKVKFLPYLFISIMILAII